MDDDDLEAKPPLVFSANGKVGADQLKYILRFGLLVCIPGWKGIYVHKFNYSPDPTLRMNGTHHLVCQVVDHHSSRSFWTRRRLSMGVVRNVLVKLLCCHQSSQRSRPAVATFPASLFVTLRKGPRLIEIYNGRWWCWWLPNGSVWIYFLCWWRCGRLDIVAIPSFYLFVIKLAFESHSKAMQRLKCCRSINKHGQ